MIDLNNALPQKGYDLIPSGTIVRAKLTLQKNHEGHIIHQSQHNSETKYLEAIFVICEYPYVGRRVYAKFGIEGSKEFVRIGQSQIKAIIESAKNIKPDDFTEKAIKKRQIDSYEALEGLLVQIKIYIKTDPIGLYEPKNRISKIITPDCSEYLIINDHQLKLVVIDCNFRSYIHE